MYAAFPAGSRLEDKQLERRWFNGAAQVEAVRGNAQLALKYVVIQLKLSEDLKDQTATASALLTLAFMAAGAGLYHDVLEYTAAALKVDGLSNDNLTELYASACINRANAFLRLGRLPEATKEIAGCLASIPPPINGRILDRFVLGQYTFCEIALERGDWGAARAALFAAAAWAEESGVPELKLQIGRLDALTSVSQLGLQVTVAKLESLLAQALNIESKYGTPFDDSTLDVLHALERVSRQHGDSVNADKWLNAIGAKMRQNVSRIAAALAENTYVSDTLMARAKMAEIDRYIYSKSLEGTTQLDGEFQSWSYLVGLAATAIGAEDPTKEHGVRVARLAGLIAQEFGLSSDLRRGIEAGCIIHDIGKVGIPSSVLLKKTRLEAGEQKLYDGHPAAGGELTEGLSYPAKSIVLNVVRLHHHLYKSSTSCVSLEGENIPLEARIASVCDRFDSLVTGRPRRPAISSDDALREIFSLRSRDFDPAVVDVFVDVVSRLQRVYPDVQAYLAEEASNIEYFATQRLLKQAAYRVLMVN